MSRKGQISVFIIIGILILLSITVVLIARSFTRTAEAEKTISFEGRVNALESFIKRCVDTTSKNALLLFGFQSGFIYDIIPDIREPIRFGGYNVHYSQDLEKNYVPDLRFSSYQLSEYVNQNMDICLGDFREFQDLDIQKAQKGSTATINDDSVVFTVNYPMTVKLGNNAKQLETFSAVVPIRLKHILEKVDEIVEFGISNPGNFEPSTIAITDLDIKVIPYSKTSYMFTIADPLSKIYGTPYSFIFAAKFKGD